VRCKIGDVVGEVECGCSSVWRSEVRVQQRYQLNPIKHVQCLSSEVPGNAAYIVGIMDAIITNQ